jgi:hypothetical protein
MPVPHNNVWPQAGFGPETSSAQQLAFEVTTDRRWTQPRGKQSIREILTRNCHLLALAVQYCAGSGQVRERENIPLFQRDVLQP